MATPNDPLYDDQWHFPLIGDIETIWDDYDGSGVTVVVYDEGVEYTHEDLAANYDSSMHFAYNNVTYDAMPVDDNSGHGTSCAGLIGAVADNGLGGTGVAPGVTLTGVNYLDDIQFQSDEIYDEAMLWAQNFDIMSNSWGWGGSFSFQQNLNNASSAASHDAELWAILVEDGRDGLGTIIVKAAGNETNNANGDGWNIIRYSICVAATEDTGVASYYSNFGSSILIAAPASAVTTDMTGSAGYNQPGTSFSDSDTIDPNYTSQFNGTSAATPTVAGVVALMLDANDTLGWRDVQTILALSASHTGSNLGGPGAADEVGNWQTVGGNTWNGGGTMFHQSYGYGMVDAYAAVRMSEAWAFMSPTAQTSDNEETATGDYNGATKNIQDNDGVAGSGQLVLGMTVAQDITIESIELKLTLTHANATNLNIWLKAPDGTTIQVMVEGDGSARTMDNGLTWVFGVVSLQGYSSAGQWKVVFEDTVTGETGSVSDASITFFGAQATTDTIFTFTDDFRMLEAKEGSRSIIDDLDGGTDWLNFAAMTGNINLDMQAGGEVLRGAKVIASLSLGADEFENAIMGDGKNKVTGNALDNEIHAMRGNDKIRAGDGADVAYGDDGDDVVGGGGGHDTLWGGGGDDKLIGNTGNDRLAGGTGADTFVFKANFSKDKIMDFEDNVDTLKLDDVLWGGGKTAAQVVDQYATVSGGNTIFDFGNGDVITIIGITDKSIFDNDIGII
jgi:subtilisin family serine protease